MRTAFATVPVLLLALTSTGVATAAEPDAQRTLSVSGVGEVSRSPDLAVISFAVETTGDTATLAGEANASRSAAVAKSLEAILGKNDRMQTTRYSLQPIYEPRERGAAASGEPKIRGYIARNQVRVEAHAIAVVGKMIDAAIAAGANRVNGLQFTLEDRKDAEAEALRKAGSRAREEAETIADALGVKIVEVLHATTVDGPSFQPRHYQGMAMAAESRTTTPIEAGDVKVTATLQVTYRIE